MCARKSSVALTPWSRSAATTQDLTSRALTAPAGNLERRELTSSARALLEEPPLPARRCGEQHERSAGALLLMEPPLAAGKRGHTSRKRWARLSTQEPPLVQGSARTQKGRRAQRADHPSAGTTSW